MLHQRALGLLPASELLWRDPILGRRVSLLLHRRLEFSTKLLSKSCMAHGVPRPVQDPKPRRDLEEKIQRSSRLSGVQTKHLDSGAMVQVRLRKLVDLTRCGYDVYTLAIFHLVNIMLM